MVNKKRGGGTATGCVTKRGRPKLPSVQLKELICNECWKHCDKELKRQKKIIMKSETDLIEKKFVITGLQADITKLQNEIQTKDDLLKKMEIQMNHENQQAESDIAELKERVQRQRDQSEKGDPSSDVSMLRHLLAMEQQKTKTLEETQSKTMSLILSARNLLCPQTSQYQSSGSSSTSTSVHSNRLMENHPQIASWTSVSLNEQNRNDNTDGGVTPTIVPIITHVESLCEQICQENQVSYPAKEEPKSGPKEPEMPQLENMEQTIDANRPDLPTQGERDTDRDSGPPALAQVDGSESFPSLELKVSLESNVVGVAEPDVLGLSPCVLEEGSPNEDHEIRSEELEGVVLDDVATDGASASTEKVQDVDINEGTVGQDKSKEGLGIEDIGTEGPQVKEQGELGCVVLEDVADDASTEKVQDVDINEPGLDDVATDGASASTEKVQDVDINEGTVGQDKSKEELGIEGNYLEGAQVEDHEELEGVVLDDVADDASTEKVQDVNINESTVGQDPSKEGLGIEGNDTEGRQVEDHEELEGVVLGDVADDASTEKVQDVDINQSTVGQDQSNMSKEGLGIEGNDTDGAQVEDHEELEGVVLEDVGDDASTEKFQEVDINGQDPSNVGLGIEDIGTEGPQVEEQEELECVVLEDVADDASTEKVQDVDINERTVGHDQSKEELGIEDNDTEGRQVEEDEERPTDEKLKSRISTDEGIEEEEFGKASPRDDDIEKEESTEASSIDEDHAMSLRDKIMNNTYWDAVPSNDSLRNEVADPEQTQCDSSSKEKVDQEIIAPAETLQRFLEESVESGTIEDEEKIREVTPTSANKKRGRSERVNLFDRLGAVLKVGNDVSQDDTIDSGKSSPASVVVVDGEESPAPIDSRANIATHSINRPVPNKSPRSLLLLAKRCVATTQIEQLVAMNTSEDVGCGDGHSKKRDFLSNVGLGENRKVSAKPPTRVVHMIMPVHQSAETGTNNFKPSSASNNGIVPVISTATTSTIVTSAGYYPSPGGVFTARISTGPDPRIRQLATYTTIMPPKRTPQPNEKMMASGILYNRASERPDSPIVQGNPENIPAVVVAATEPKLVSHICPVHGNVTRKVSAATEPLDRGFTPVQEKMTSPVPKNLSSLIEIVELGADGQRSRTPRGPLPRPVSLSPAPPACPPPFSDHDYLASPVPPSEPDNRASPAPDATETAPKGSSYRRKSSKPVKLTREGSPVVITVAVPFPMAKRDSNSASSKGSTVQNKVSAGAPTLSEGAGKTGASKVSDLNPGGKEVDSNEPAAPSKRKKGKSKLDKNATELGENAEKKHRKHKKSHKHVTKTDDMVLDSDESSLASDRSKRKKRRFEETDESADLSLGVVEPTRRTRFSPRKGENLSLEKYETKLNKAAEKCLAPKKTPRSNCVAFPSMDIEDANAITTPAKTTITTDASSEATNSTLDVVTAPTKTATTTEASSEPTNSTLDVVTAPAKTTTGASSEATNSALDVVTAPTKTATTTEASSEPTNSTLDIVTAPAKTTTGASSEATNSALDVVTAPTKTATTTEASSEPTNSTLDIVTAPAKTTTGASSEATNSTLDVGSPSDCPTSTPPAMILETPLMTAETRGEKRRRIAAVMNSISERKSPAKPKSPLRNVAPPVRENVSAVEKLFNEMSADSYGEKDDDDVAKYFHPNDFEKIPESVVKCLKNAKNNYTTMLQYGMPVEKPDFMKKQVPTYSPRRQATNSLRRQNYPKESLQCSLCSPRRVTLFFNDQAELAMHIYEKHRNMDPKVVAQAMELLAIKTEPPSVQSLQLTPMDRRTKKSKRPRMRYSSLQGFTTSKHETVKCDICEKTFASKTSLSMHMKRHTEKKIECVWPKCEKKFHIRSDMLRHMRRHTGEKPFKCKECGKAFAQYSHLQVHERTHSGDKPFLCVLCSSSFSQRAHLKSHLATHTGEKRFFCDLKGCGKAFFLKDKLEAHYSTHTGTKNHVCEECGKRFNHISNLQKHLRIHAGDRRHPCPYCEKKFYTATDLKTHIRSHSGERPYMCEICQKSFITISNLRKHEVTHKEYRKFYDCSDCGAKYSSYWNYNRHKETRCSYAGMLADRETAGGQ